MKPALSSRVTKVFGSPGTGKTTYLLDRIEEHLAKMEKRGVSVHRAASRIAFISFTNKAVDEAKNRVAKRFGLDAKALPFFRTFHSLCWMLTDKKFSNAINDFDMRKFCKSFGVPWFEAEQVATSTADTGGVNNLVTVDTYLRRRCVDVRDTDFLQSLALSGLRVPNMGEFEFANFRAMYAQFKKESKKVDFTDVLCEVVENQAAARLSLDLCLVDEAQDLCKLQFNIVEQLVKSSDKLYLAGDDDQAIYTWSGADVASFLNFPAGETVVLDKTYRLPKSVFSFSQGIVKNIIGRQKKTVAPVSREGHLDLGKELVTTNYDFREETMLLTWTNERAKFYAEQAASMEWLFSSDCPTVDHYPFREDVETYIKVKSGEFTHVPATTIGHWLRYYDKDDPLVKKLLQSGNQSLSINDQLVKRLMTLKIHQLCGVSEQELGVYRNHYKLFGHLKPWLHISTIFKQKGGEASHVIVSSDVGGRTEEKSLFDPNFIHRTAYVGVTRAKNRLSILVPNKKNFYQFVETC